MNARTFLLPSHVVIAASSSEAQALQLALARLSSPVASLIPVLMLGYVMIIWPLVFGGGDYSPIEVQAGWMAPLPPDAGERSPLKMIAYPLLFVLAVISSIFTGSYRRLPFDNPGIAAVVGVIALAVASASWSLFPQFTFMRGALLGIISTTLILSVYSAHSFRVMMLGLFAVVVVAMALNLVSVATQPPGPIGHTGIYPQKNVFGWVSGVILFVGLYHLTFGGLLQRSIALAMIVAAPVFLILSQSKTSLGLSLLAPVVGLMLLYPARRMLISPAIVVSAGVLLAALVYFIGESAGLWTFKWLSQKLLGDPTLTGRTDLWDFAATLIAAQPWLGYGYEAVWGLGYDGLPYRMTLGFARVAPTGHNGYIDMLLHLGLLGFALKVAFLLAALTAAGRLARRDGRLGWLSLTIVVFVLLHNNLESDIFISSNPLWMLMLLFFAIGLRVSSAR